jgi:DNA-binding protein H-NS
MARQLAPRTVITWFGNLPFDQQNDVLDKMQQAHQQSRSAKRAELERELAALGFSVAKKRGRPRASSVGVMGTVRKARRKMAKVKAKYRDPRTNDTWSGRGRMASWLKGKQDAGEKIEKYLV